MAKTVSDFFALALCVNHKRMAYCHTVVLQMFLPIVDEFGTKRSERVASRGDGGRCAMFPNFLGRPRDLLLAAQPVRRTPRRGLVAPGSGSTGFKVQPQPQSNWCWAAVSTSVAAFYKAPGSWTQCKVANAELSRADCCGIGASGPCNIPWYLDRALTRVGCFSGISASVEPLANVQAEVAATRVLCLRIGWTGGGGHFIAIAGWYTGASGVVYINVEDPISGAVQVPYTKLVSAYQNAGRWTHSYRTVAGAVRALQRRSLSSAPPIRSPKGG